MRRRRRQSPHRSPSGQDRSGFSGTSLLGASLSLGLNLSVQVAWRCSAAAIKLDGSGPQITRSRGTVIERPPKFRGDLDLALPPASTEHAEIGSGNLEQLSNSQARRLHLGILSPTMSTPTRNIPLGDKLGPDQFYDRQFSSPISVASPSRRVNVITDVVLGTTRRSAANLPSTCKGRPFIRTANVALLRGRDRPAR